MRFGLVGDLILADGPVLSGLGPYSATKGDFREVFKTLKNITASYDFLVGNFEAVLVDHINRVSPSTSSMKTPKQVISCLYDTGFRYVSIANNHTMEYGKKAFVYMCKMLDSNGIQTFGHKECPYIIIEQHLHKIGIFAFSTVPAFYGYTPEYYYVDSSSSDEKTRITDIIVELKNNCDYLIAYPHWGFEFVETPARFQFELAASMVEAGVDLIVGAHPHVIQEAYLYKTVPVYFSIGNLISDYPQIEMKKNLFITVGLRKDLYNVRNQILTSDKKYIILTTDESIQYNEWPGTFPDEVSYNKHVNLKRKSVRRELLLYLFKHPRKVVLNYNLIIWLIKRFFFLILNRKNISENPGSIYSGPIH